MKSLIDSYFGCYAIHCMSYLKVVIPNTVLAVPTFGIIDENSYSNQLQKNSFEKVQSTLRKHFDCSSPKEIFNCSKIKKNKALVVVMIYHDRTRIKCWVVCLMLYIFMLTISMFHLII